jgi:hypothetical protein
LACEEIVHIAFIDFLSLLFQGDVLTFEVFEGPVLVFEILLGFFLDRNLLHWSRNDLCGGGGGCLGGGSNNFCSDCLW